MADMKGRVLIVAGSDSGGGAGIQADIKAVTALGGFAMTAITALTAQNTQGVHGIHDVPADFVARQMSLVLDDIGADCIKIGMLHRADIIEAVVETLAGKAKGIPVVADPVMVAKGGHALLAETAETALKNRLIPAASLITPNLPEAEVLTGYRVRTPDDMKTALKGLTDMGARAVLLKGGHLEGDDIVDLLGTADGKTVSYKDKRIDTPNTHGTGCTLASAIACGVAQGLGLSKSVARARKYVRRAIETNPGFGTGHGPLNHAVTVAPFEV